MRAESTPLSVERTKRGTLGSTITVFLATDVADIVPLFISAFRRADELATAMECRLYRGDVGRTRMRQLKIARVDICSMLLVAVLFAAVIALRRLGL